MANNPHRTLTQSFNQRASNPNAHPLSTYLLRLISIKRSNLCVSADVTTTSALLRLAEEVGDTICVLKTHADIVDDFGEKTIKGLRDVARRKKFVIFEDRKFGDIGSTVQKQYTSGPLRIIKWAPLTNAHIFPGPAIIGALKEAAATSIAKFNQSVETEISAGTPRSSTESGRSDAGEEFGEGYLGEYDGRRKGSIVAATTIETRTEMVRSPDIAPMGEGDAEGEREEALEALGEVPWCRGLLLLAQMSSEENLLTETYTEKCVEMARKHTDFVLGFIAQRSLNKLPEDDFLTFTPGVSLPAEGRKMGDSLGQQYNTPRKVVLEEGCDIIIVGRGIITATDRPAEAERYRKEAWTAYEERIGKGRRR
ncbi:MAG: orotidine 5'-phosphate decarboxylase [Pycnora praestabilis]|nr:MAG: orotidine 5'-phosphate decarboxylase [Pycnora praestabilis]